ncbi:putative membrane protein [Labrenzia sp. EL_208]|nr:putative membrane protein [Labrenzia sp. EL_132]MBG6228972.1 putative membrane protein [Labrenzia sp. EL_208]
MTETNSTESIVPLGVGTLIGDSFSILFRNIVPIVLIAFVPSLLGVLLSGYLVGFEALLSLGETDAPSGAASALTSLVDLVVYSLTTAFLVQLAYDAKLNRPIRIAKYIRPALASVIPIAILGIVVGLLIGLAAIAFIIPGLWVYAVFSVMEPAVVIERLGFRGLGRSEKLTKNYRWPIVGALVLAWICALVIIVVALFAADFALTSGVLAVSIFLYATFTAVGTGLLSILTALIYARLREIKEGVSVDQIAEVFD